MKNLWVIVLCLVVAGGAARGSAQVALTAQDKQGINATMDAFGPDLFKLDMDSFATLFTDDADWINIVGMHWSGKAQIVKGHRSVFSTRYKGVTMHNLERSISEVTPGVVVVINKQRMGDEAAADGKPITDNVSILTAVLVKREGKWLIRSGENVVIDQRAAAHDPVKMP